MLPVYGQEEVNEIIEKMEQSGITDDVRVLDAGCNDGYISHLLYETATGIRFQWIVGIDAEKFSYRERTFNGHRDYDSVERIFIQADLLSFLKRYQAEYDLIIMRNILHFLTPDELRESIGLLPKMMAENALVYVDMFNRSAAEEIESGYCKSVFDEGIHAEILKQFDVVVRTDYPLSDSRTNKKTRLFLRKK